MSTLVLGKQSVGGVPAPKAGEAHDHKPHGWRRGVFATNHKDIGTMYLVFSFTMFMAGGVLALIIRAGLFQPGLQFVNPQLFNQLTSPRATHAFHSPLWKCSLGPWPILTSPQLQFNDRACV